MPCALEAAASAVPPHAAPGLSICQTATDAVSTLYATSFARPGGHQQSAALFPAGVRMHCSSARLAAKLTVQGGQFEHHGCHQQSDSCQLRPDQGTHRSSSAQQLSLAQRGAICRVSMRSSKVTNDSPTIDGANVTHSYSMMPDR